MLSCEFTDIKLPGINDPCAPGYDAINNVFHLSYQWNPHSPFWNHISWGHATSPDLLTWKYTDTEVNFTKS